MKRHLLICGERGVGKSTLIRRLLEHSTREVGGFVTKRLLSMHVTHSRLNTRVVQTSRELGCCIVFIDFFLVIYIGMDNLFSRNKKAVTGKLLLFCYTL